MKGDRVASGGSRDVVGRKDEATLADVDIKVGGLYSGKREQEDERVLETVEHDGIFESMC
jgi:hypothetical protein